MAMVHRTRGLAVAGLMTVGIALAGVPSGADGAVPHAGPVDHPASVNHSWLGHQAEPAEPGRNDALSGVDVLTKSDAWAVGWHSPAYADHRNLAMHWDGRAWSKVPTPQPGREWNGLADVAALASDDVWAVGGWADTYEGFSSNLAMHWDGQAWTVVPTPNPGAAYNGFSAVSAVASNDVWAVGSADPDFDGGQAPEAEHWDGSTWAVVDLPPLPAEGVFTDVSAAAADDVWIVGRTYVGHRARPVAEHYDGTDWTLVATPGPHGAGSFFEGVTAVSPT